MKRVMNSVRNLTLSLVMGLLTLGHAWAQDPCKLRIVGTVSQSNPLMVQFKALPRDSNAIPCFSPNTVYNWTFGDAGTATGSVVNHNYNQGGTYLVCVNANTVQGVPVTECDTIFLNPIQPFCQFTFTYQAALPTIPLTLQFTATGGFVSNNCYQPGSAYIWTWGDGTTTTTTNPASATHTFPAPGNYNVCLRGTLVNGQVYQYCSAVTVSGPVQNAQFAGQVYSGGACEPSHKQVHFISLDGQIHIADSVAGWSDSCFYFYSVPSQPARNYVVWANPVGNPSYLPTYLGDVLYFSEATVLSNPANLNLVSYQPPINLIPDMYDSLVLDSIQPPGLITGNVGGSGMVVNSTLGNRPTSIAFNYALARVLVLTQSGQPVAAVSINPDGSYSSPALPPGNYTIRIEHPLVPTQISQVSITPTSLNRVANFSVSSTGVNTVTSNQNLLKAGKLKVYPNPAKDLVRVFGVKGNVQFMDMQGKIALESPAESAISVAELKPGVYMLKGMDDKGNVMISRLVIQ